MTGCHRGELWVLIGYGSTHSRRADIAGREVGGAVVGTVVWGVLRLAVGRVSCEVLDGKGKGFNARAVKQLKQYVKYFNDTTRLDCKDVHYVKNDSYVPDAGLTCWEGLNGVELAIPLVPWKSPEEMLPPTICRTMLGTQSVSQCCYN